MAGPRTDTRGILHAPELMARVRFRRRVPAPPLRRYVEHYWLIDWDLSEPHQQHVVPHPSVNLVFQRSEPGPPVAEVAGVGLELFSIKLEGVGRVAGVQFRPGGFRPFCRQPVSGLTGRRIPMAEIVPDADDAAARILTDGSASDDERVAALDEVLLRLDPQPDPLADRAMRLVDTIRRDRTLRRVGDLARQCGLSPRSLQRLFAEYVGVSPKWVLLRYRVHEAIECATADVDWASLAAELGYSDQAHLVRDFTATVGVSPTAYPR